MEDLGSWQQLEEGMRLHAGPACPVCPNNYKQVEAGGMRIGCPRPVRGAVQEEASVAQVGGRVVVGRG